MADLKETMAKMNESVAHHFVPQHLQANFTNDPKEEVSVFDVTDGRKYPSGTKGVMQQGHFHTVFRPGGRVNFESAMTEIENSVLSTYSKIVRNRSLTLSDDEIGNLSILVAFQELRTAGFRSHFLRLEAQLAEHAEKFGVTLDQIEGYRPLNDANLKTNHLLFLYEHLQGFARIVSSRDFVLLTTPKDKYFYLSDNPVVRHNGSPAGFWSNHGFASEGLQIYMPLSKDLLLGVWAKDLLAKVRDRVAEGRRLHARYTLSPSSAAAVQHTPGGADLIKASLGHTRADEEMLRKIAAGCSLKLENANVDFYNSLQMNNAIRQIVCPFGKFDLADRWFAGKQ